MTTQDIANRLVELCRQGQHTQAYQELFSENAVAIEPAHSQAPETSGLSALLEKYEQFGAAIDTVHGGFVSDPLVANNFFSVTMGMDLTMKDGNRMNMEEVCVYEVQDGKIVKEQFFF